MLPGAEDRGIDDRVGGDTNRAAQFAKSVPDFVLKGRFVDVVRPDLAALEQEMGFAVGRGGA